INKEGGLDLQYVGGTSRQPLSPKPIKFFGDGPGGIWVGAQATIQRWFADPLYDNTGACSDDPKQACTLLDISNCAPNATCDVSAGLCSDNGAKCTASNRAACGVVTAECIPFHDRTLRTVFTHDHFGPSTHQQAGLYAGLVVEPKGSLWRENQNGNVFGGFDPATGKIVDKRFDGGPTTWQAVIETRDQKESFREFLVELQDSTLMYWPFGVRDFILDPQDPSWKQQFAKEDTRPCKPGEPCGFCGNDGVCVKEKSGQIPETPTLCDVSTVGLQPPSPVRTCPSGTTCRLRTGFLKACTSEPAGFKDCSGQAYDAANPKRKGVFKSCNLLVGIPDASWNAWAQTPIDPPIDKETNQVVPEVITFFGATNNFSFNYRNEPLFPRIVDPFKGTILQSKAGDLAYVYSSDPSISRPNPRGSACSGNLWQPCDASHTCPFDAGACQPVNFCSDNYALCTAGNMTLCKDKDKATCDQTSPYPALTAGVQPGDPFTPLLRAYPGDDVQLRTLTGAHLNPHNFTIQGLNWLMQPSFVDSGWRNSQVMGISEHFDLISRLPAASASGTTSDFLYQPGAAALEQSAGNWGIIRTYGQQQADLFPVPNNAPSAKSFDICPKTQPKGTRVRTYNVVAVRETLTYNQGLSDAKGLVLYRCPAGTPLASCAPSSNWTPTPLVLRAGAGDCIKVNLRNAIPSNTQIKGASDLQLPIPAGCRNADYPPDPAPQSCVYKSIDPSCVINDPKCGQKGHQLCCCCLPSNTSLQVGLRPQLVSFDVRTSGGVNVGLNPEQTAGPGEVVSYSWYAGNLDSKATTDDKRYIPIEFGSANLLPPDVLNQYGHGLFGALIVEPFGSTGWEDGGTTAEVTEPDGSKFKEFVVFTQDNVPMQGGVIEGANYASELLGAPPARLCDTCSPSDFSCLYTNKPFSGTPDSCNPSSFTPVTPIFTACAGESVRFRLLHPGGINTDQVFEIYGHNWSESPYMTAYDHCEAPTTQTNLWASQKQGTTNLCANEPYTLAKLKPTDQAKGGWQASLNAWQGSHMGHGPSNHLDILIPQAGGPFKQAGTYLYRTYPAMHFQLGLWGWFNVVQCPQKAKPDTALKNQWQGGGQ
ncbi:MAG TPA: hypothetical protein VF173_22445, partial [Thermoanaerobaculia bacterium]|nr:hypothetical protein [Thermoanaerobaculia bacterium]